MQQAPMKFDPYTGRANPTITNAAHYRDKFNLQWCYDPWTRAFRYDARHHDFVGITIVEPGAEPDSQHLAELQRIAGLCAYLQRCEYFALVLDVDALTIKVCHITDREFWRYLRLTNEDDRAEFDALVAAARPLVFDESEI